MGHVAVVATVQSRETAAWFDTANRYFDSKGPYLYDSLRYFLYLGTGSESGRRKSAGHLSKPSDEELEPLEFEDATGEMISMGSPQAKVPKKPDLPAAPKTPALPGLPDIPQAPDLPAFAAPELPAVPELPALSGLAAIPDMPSLPGFEIPGLPTMPEIAAIPALVPGPDADKKLFPIEFQLLNGQGDPFPATDFRVTLPDGSIREGKSGPDGFIRIPDNPQEGDASLQLIHDGAFPQTFRRDAARQ